MNHHLQLFRFFHESEDPLHIENNLTRAFALCLKHDRTLLFAFLKQWLKEEDFNYLLSNPPDEAEIEIDLQIETAELVDNTRRLYAIGVTENNEYKDWSDITYGATRLDKQNITDLIIAVKDITIIMEVKRSMEDCKGQLCQQILPFINDEKPATLVAFHYPWQQVMDQVKKVHHFNLLTNGINPFTSSLLELITGRFNHWIPTTCFAHLGFDKNHNTQLHHKELYKRLQKCMATLGNDALAYFNDRIAIRMSQPWASEAIPKFELIDGKPYLVLDVWPGNVKQQGWSIYSKPLEWAKLKKLTVGEEVFPVGVSRHIKFMHFNRYVTSIDIPMKSEDRLRKEINTPENFRKSGKWERDRWSKLDEFFCEHFNFDWKAQCKWDECFEDTERGYLTFSLGFLFSLKIPYEFIQKIDKQPEDQTKVGHFLKECIQAIVDAIEGRSDNMELKAA
jgi:hypothetical protein